jgi:hypothetical protein
MRNRFIVPSVPFVHSLGGVAIFAALATCLMARPAEADTYTGYIDIYQTSSGTNIGSISSQFTNAANHRYGITTNPAQRMQVSFTDNSTPFSISILNGTNPSYSYLGAVVGPASSNEDLSTGSINYDLLTATALTSPGAPPSSAGNAYNGQSSEGAIWSFSSATSTLTAQWVNTDSSRPTTYLYYLPGSDGLLLVGDPTAFNDNFPGGYQVSYRFVGTAASTAPEPGSLALLLPVLPVMGMVGMVIRGQRKRRKN